MDAWEPRYQDESSLHIDALRGVLTMADQRRPSPPSFWLRRALRRNAFKTQIAESLIMGPELKDQSVEEQVTA